MMRTSPPRLCDFSSVPCPCKVVDLENDVLICDFIRQYSVLDIKGDSKGLKTLLNKVCIEVRDEILHHKLVVRRNKKLARSFLKEVKIGDTVFCTAEIENVIFLEFPTWKYDQCKYKASDGFIGKAPAFAFRVISRGKEHARYETKDNEKAIKFARYAKRYGFRVEEQKVKDTYIVDIYGEKQEELEEYIINFDNGLVLNTLEDF